MIYRRIHDTAPTRRSRGVQKARYVYGDGDAKNRYVYCQYCGFICDTKRDVLQPTSGVVAIPSDIKEGAIGGYEPLKEYKITHNCPFCGGQYTI